MKRNVWICLLVFSLALNLGGLAAFLFLRFQDQQRLMGKRGIGPPPPREIWASLNLEAEQRQVLDSLLPEHRRRIRGLRAGLAQQRYELFEMVKKEAAAWPAIQAKVKEVSGLQGKLEEEVLRFFLVFQEHLRPDQRAAFIAFMECRMPGVPGGKGSGPPGRKRGPKANGPCGPFSN